MRDIVKVIDDIIAATPDKIFIEKLSSVKQNCLYCAPEDMQRMWHELGDVFNSNIPYPPVEPWHKKVASIFTGGVYE